MKNIYLIGFMGSGKSSVGKRLSELLDVAYADTDSLVIEHTKKKIVDIFSEEGEDAFRNHESAALLSVPKDNCVVSTGGGIVTSEKNCEQMKQTGIVLYLETSFYHINERLKQDQSRPLWTKGREDNRKLFDIRRTLYRTYADVTISTDNKSVTSIAEEIINYIINE